MVVGYTSGYICIYIYILYIYIYVCNVSQRKIMQTCTQANGGTPLRIEALCFNCELLILVLFQFHWFPIYWMFFSSSSEHRLVCSDRCRFNQRPARPLPGAHLYHRVPAATPAAEESVESGVRVVGVSLTWWLRAIRFLRLLMPVSSNGIIIFCSSCYLIRFLCLRALFGQTSAI